MSAVGIRQPRRMPFEAARSDFGGVEVFIGGESQGLKCLMRKVHVAM